MVNAVDVRGRKVLCDGGLVIIGEAKHEFPTDMEAVEFMFDIWAYEILTSGTNPRVIAGWLIDGGVEVEGATVYDVRGEVLRAVPVEGGYLLSKNGGKVGVYPTISQVAKTMVEISPRK